MRSNAPTSNAGMTTVVPAASTYEQLAVAAGDVEQRHRHQVAQVDGAGKRMMRRHVSLFDRKFSWVVMAPLGNPVVPLV